MEPGFLEAFTYRWYGHVDWRDKDTDVGLNRSSHEIKSWKKSDPVERFEKCLFKLNAINQKLKEKISFELDTCIEESWSKAMKDPYPEEKSIKDYVYKKMVNKKINYGTAILHGFEYLLENHKEVFVLGQGL